MLFHYILSVRCDGSPWTYFMVIVLYWFVYLQKQVLWIYDKETRGVDSRDMWAEDVELNKKRRVEAFLLQYQFKMAQNPLRRYKRSTYFFIIISIFIYNLYSTSRSNFYSELAQLSRLPRTVHNLAFLPIFHRLICSRAISCARWISFLDSRSFRELFSTLK